MIARTRSTSPLAAALVAAVALLPGLAAAKPLYITVSRSFGSQESPVVDVAFDSTLGLTRAARTPANGR